MNRDDFQQLAEMRIEEAKALLDAGKWSGAYYLAGYAVECALKACIAKLTKEYDFPDKDVLLKCYNHNIEVLVKQAGLQNQRDADAPTGSPQRAKWNTVGAWDESSRYRLITQAKAEALFLAITDPQDGVLTWIKKYW